MATTTTNFGWDIPQSTDLVKDGATAIAALGQDIDTAFVDFKGGTTGQVLKKTSGTDLDVEWGTASSGLTLINTTSFSGVSSVSAPANTFSATYNRYLISFNELTGTGSYAGIRLRASGSDDSTANYRAQQLDVNGSSVTSSRLTGRTSWETLFLTESGFTNFSELLIVNPFLTQVTSANSFGVRTSNGNVAILQHNLGMNTATSYDSITLIGTSISGSMSVYGYNK
jgi:hypothetical protein